MVEAAVRGLGMRKLNRKTTEEERTLRPEQEPAREALSDERRAFLRARMEALAAERPLVREFERKLLALGGEAVVFPPSLAFFFPFERIVRDGQAWRLRRMRIPGPPSLCHENSAAEWWRSRGRTQLVTGWALSPEDGLWRQHSWCMGDGCILETTPSPRRTYFGVVLAGPEAFMVTGVPAARRLVERNLAPPEWLVILLQCTREGIDRANLVHAVGGIDDRSVDGNQPLRTERIGRGG